MKKILKMLRKQILKEYGKKCPEFVFHCVVCQVYMALNILEDLEDCDVDAKH